MVSQFSRAPATLVLLIINVLLFVVQELLLPLGAAQSAMLFGLNFPDLLGGQFWRLLSHQFIHGNLLHLLFNMMALWFAGTAVEQAIGTRRYLTIYFIAGIVGGLAQMAFNLQPPYVDLIGASGAVCGILMTFCTLFPSAQITALIFFVLPIRLRAKTLGIGIVVFSILFWLSGIDDNIGHLAHLGGFLAGFIGGLWCRKRAVYPGIIYHHRPVRPPPLPPEHMYSDFAAFDRILEKISREGFAALSAEERRQLEEGRNRFLRKSPDDLT